ncbi:hypothetical protein FXO38_21946 [Capsicum annuum]|nr:hypothetical protein FXO37_29125 [Capsicum annuum]KAF3640805.1 hypothetical protein FXO38_21946 [Capsicum annuum]
MASEINELYFAYDLDSVVKCKKMIFGRCQSFMWLARVIAKGLPPWANGVGQIKTRDHSVQAKHWLGFVDNHLLPSRNDQDIMIDRAIIVECIMDKITINPGELIVEMMKLRSKQSSTLLPFPTLISMLYLKFKVLLFSKIDRRVICTRVIDITH